MKQRLSKLQKDILVALYNSPKEDYDDGEQIDKNDSEGIKQLEANGYKFWSEFGGRCWYRKKITVYKMRRDKLLFRINDWQKYNIYTEDSTSAKIGNGYWGRGKPDDYNTKQSSFTRSLQTLASSDLVYLLHMFDELVGVYGKIFASKMGTEAKTLDEHRKEGMNYYTERYKKEKEKNPDIGTFEEWFKKPTQNIVGEFTSRAKLYTENYKRLDMRNTKHVVLAEKGKEKANELLKVK